MKKRIGLADIFLTLNYGESYKNLKRAIYQTNLSAHSTLKPPSDAVLRATLSRLKKQGYLALEKKRWTLTKLGEEYFARTKSDKRTNLNNARKNLIISFDIPERFKDKRNWLRYKLKEQGFGMIHKSLWFGPGPLSRTFIESLNSMDLLSHMKFFKASETEIV